MSHDERKSIICKISHMLPEQEFTYFSYALAALPETTQTDLLVALNSLIDDGGIVNIRYYPPNKDTPIIKEIIEILDGWIVWTDPTRQKSLPLLNIVRYINYRRNSPITPLDV